MEKQQDIDHIEITEEDEKRVRQLLKEGDDLAEAMAKKTEPLHRLTAEQRALQLRG